jgi:hypothetical protein
MAETKGSKKLTGEIITKKGNSIFRFESSDREPLQMEVPTRLNFE